MAQQPLVGQGLPNVRFHFHS